MLVRREDEFRTLWRWLQGFPKDATPEKRAAAGYPRIILAYGERDPFLRTHEGLRSLVPAEDVVRIAGVHTFGTFRALFDTILDKGLLELGGRGPLDVIDPKQSTEAGRCFLMPPWTRTMGRGWAQSGRDPRGGPRSLCEGRTAWAGA